MSEYQGKQGKSMEILACLSVPYFNDFITENKMNLMQWLKYNQQTEPMALFALWRSRFAMALRDYKKLGVIVEGKGTYNKAFWEDILKGTEALYDTRVTSTVNGIGATVMATVSATTMLAESFTTTDNELIADSSTATVDNTTAATGKEGTIRTAAETASRSYEATSTSTITPTTTGDDTIASIHLTWDKIPADDHELRFYYLAHKKCFPSALLNEEEKMHLS
ncbi:hypothetical protein INT46_000007 [Mucor plumbeus]|uniref:Uncharacterized protein n=1 Tax=Mucor plumbeus TaxID=97098 RepID=A0A8H7QHV7_9FUNG|nr:hypothetical protein INT46_000007 [Mucor plumbeus]